MIAEADESDLMSGTSSEDLRFERKYRVGEIMRLVKGFLLFLTLCTAVEAKVSVPKIFSDNMVLQRESAIPVWGWANPKETITVTFNKQAVSAVTDASGKWSIKLKSEKAGTNLTLKISGENTIEIKNVAVGEVWLCSGQSNMEWTVGQSMNAEQELSAAENPNIRQVKISKSINSIPQNDVDEGVWKVSDPINTKGFTGVGYFFARALYNQLKAPIGLINASWGGTNIETWISREGFESSDEFREMIARMPKIDIDALAKAKLAKVTADIEQLQGVKLGSFNAEAFKNESFEDSTLPEINVPGYWEQQSLGIFDGVVWLRRDIVLTARQAAGSGIIELAKIDDNDMTFLNGIEIGRTNGSNTPRKYRIPNGILKEGRNVIAVKATDTGGNGGIYGAIGDLRLVLADEVVSLAGNWKYQVESIQAGTNVNEFPSLAYNAMISPLIPFGLRGVLWYQGESNAGRAYQYRKAFPLLINDWRSKWKSDFPFYFVQLATFKSSGDSKDGSGWAELREAQTRTLSLAKTGMAVTTDIGDPNDIHPRNKQDVGKRLAAIALNRTYKKRFVDSGPVFESIRMVGDKAIITFENIGSGLKTTGKNGQVFGFEIAGGDQSFYPATATIQGKTVIVASEKVASPQAVRFGWIGDASACNLFNQEGFPAVPFRTDDWKTITKDAKYRIRDIMDF